MRNVWVSLAALLLACISAPRAAASAAEAPPTKVSVYEVKNVPKQRIFIRCGSVAESEVIALRKRLMESGAEKVNLFFSSVIACEIPTAVDPAELIGDSRVSFVEESLVDVAKSNTDNVARVKQCYEMANKLASGGPSLVPSVDFHDRVIYASPEVIERSKRRPVEGAPGEVAVGRGVTENAEFLIGDVLVRLIYPESEGAVQTENWTDRELRDANQGAVAGTLAWQQTFSYVPISFVFTKLERAATSYEPIHHNMGDDATTWIPDVMSNMGYGGPKDAAVMVHNYNENSDDGRGRYGTDWAFSVFIANSRNEPGHIFSGSVGGAGYTAYALGGGPYFVIPFPAGAVNPNELSEIDLFSKIYQHEMAHIFWALDEYTAAPTDCQSHAGYLNYLNRNKLTRMMDGSIKGCPDYVDCLMWNARASEESGRPICKWTAGQVGTIDGNGNGIPDLFDKAPTVVFEGDPEEYVRDPNITLKMMAKSLAVPNNNPHHDNGKDYAAPLKDAVLSIDGVGEIRLDPDDGRWDEVEEELTFDLHGLSGGLTRVQVRARNAFGAASGTIEKRIYFLGLKFALFAFRVERDFIETNWQTVGETFGARIDLYRITNAGGTPVTELLLSDVQPENPGELFQRYKYEDRDIVPGREYRYYVVGSFEWESPDTTETILTQSETFGIRAMLPMSEGHYVSNVAPNPFRETTTISIDVPQTFVDSDVNDFAGGLGILREVPTQVSIQVYDVKGRRVKDVFTGSLYSRVESFTWDGTNANNERVPSGIYFLKATAGTVQDVKKVVVVR
jgi:hypothetical protein